MKTLSANIIIFVFLANFSLCLGEEYESVQSRTNIDKEAEFNIAYRSAVQNFIEKKFNEALEALRRAEELKPNQDKTENLKGAVYLQTREFLMAEEAFQKALKINPNLSMARFNLGETYFVSKKYPEAKKIFQEILKTEPPTNYTGLIKFKIILSDYLTGVDRNIESQISRLNIQKNDNEPCYEFCLAAQKVLNGKMAEAFRPIGDIYKKYPIQEVTGYVDALEEIGYLPKPSAAQVGKIMESGSKMDEIAYGSGNKLVLGFIDNKYFIFSVSGNN